MEIRNQEIDLTRYFNLVHRIARRYALATHARNVRDSDAYAEGLLLLVKARQKFDPEYGATFLTYAYHCISRGLSTWYKKNRRYQSINGLSIKAKEDERRWGFDDIQKIQELLSTFEPTSQEYTIFSLRLQGLTYDEISKVIGFTKQNAEKFFRRHIIPVIIKAFDQSEKKNDKFNSL